jgi:hypothetical protein
MESSRKPGETDWKMSQKIWQTGQVNASILAFSLSCRAEIQ